MATLTVNFDYQSLLLESTLGVSMSGTTATIGPFKSDIANDMGTDIVWYTQASDPNFSENASVSPSGYAGIISGNSSTSIDVTLADGTYVFYCIDGENQRAEAKFTIATISSSSSTAIAGTGNPSTTTVSLVDGKITMYNAGQFGPTGDVYRSLESIAGVNSRVLNELVNAGQSVVQASVTKNTAEDETYPNTVTDNGTSSLVSDTYYYYAINDMSMQEDEQGTYMDAYLMAVVDYTAASSGTPEQLTAPVATCTATATTITPTWSAVTNATGYKLRYSTSNPPTGDGTTSTSGTAITGLTESTTYYIQVKAIGDGTTYSDSEWSTVATQATTATPDTTPPVITLTGEASVTINVGDTWTDPGATATDNVDASVTVTSSITLGGQAVQSVDTSTAGTYTITYNASDTAGNAATPVTRTVLVNTVPSAISLAGATSNAKTIRRVVGQTAPYSIGGLTVTDSDEGDSATLAITSQTISGDESPEPEQLNYFSIADSTLTAMSTTPPGIYLVTVTATDSHGATKSQAFTITMASALIDPVDFVATTLSATSVQAGFTIPTGTSNTAHIKWQRSTNDPDAVDFDSSSWTTLKTTDITGTEITQ